LVKLVKAYKFTYFQVDFKLEILFISEFGRQNPENKFVKLTYLKITKKSKLDRRIITLLQTSLNVLSSSKPFKHFVSVSLVCKTSLERLLGSLQFLIRMRFY